MESNVDTTKNEEKDQLSKETVEALQNLCSILKPIYLRMKREGYDIVDGQLIKRNDGG